MFLLGVEFPWREVSSSPRSVSIVTSRMPHWRNSVRSEEDRIRKRCLRNGVSIQDRSIPQRYMPTLTDAIGMRFFAIVFVFRKSGRLSIYLLNNDVGLEYRFSPVRTFFMR